MTYDLSRREFINMAGLGVVAFALPTFSMEADLSKGLAVAYPEYTTDLSGIDWFYAWGTNQSDDPRYVPMSWSGDDPNLPTDYSGFVLLFNEPENPSQANIAPEIAVQKYMALYGKYPNAKWVVGNSIFWGHWQNWLVAFRSICVANGYKIPDYWGIHVYLGGGAEWIPYVQSELDRLHNSIGGTFWITEFAEINGNIAVDDKLMKLFQATPYIERYAYFTNRSISSDPWVLDGWRVDMYSQYGTLTAVGDWYINGLRKTYMPMVQYARPG